MELFERYRPEYVTMDLTMPVMDGLTCISRMMTLSRTHRLMGSRPGRRRDRHRGGERGANEYVVNRLGRGPQLRARQLVAGV